MTCLSAHIPIEGIGSSPLLRRGGTVSSRPQYRPPQFCRQVQARRHRERQQPYYLSISDIHVKVGKHTSSKGSGTSDFLAFVSSVFKDLVKDSLTAREIATLSAKQCRIMVDIRDSTNLTDT